MSGVNKAIILGRLGKDPEIRSTQQGVEICSMSLATSETWKDKSGEKKERTEWHRIVIFNEALAKIAGQYLKKGSEVYIEGKIVTRKWQDKEGADRYSTEIVVDAFNGKLALIGGRANGGGSDEERPPSERKRTPGTTKGPGYVPHDTDTGELLDDEVPF